MRWIVVVLLLACGACESPAPAQPAPASKPTAADAGVATKLPPHKAYADLGAALTATIPANARVVGFGELHARVDRAQVRTSLAAFTAALPSIADKISDLVVETWVVDPKCGQQAVKATSKIEGEVKRPAAVKSEVALLVEAARSAKIQPHAMTLSCKDYETIAPSKGDVDAVAMLTLTTKELTRIATSAIAYRDKNAEKRPWIALYGGALHNDRFPEAAVAEWSYAKAVDKASKDHFVEIDIFVPELAEADATSQAQPWFPLVAAAKQVLVWQRGERSFVVILPRGGKP